MNVLHKDEEFHVITPETDDVISGSLPRGPLLDALVTVLESICRYYEESGLPPNIVMGLFNRVTRVRITDSPIIFKDNRFQAATDEKDPEVILETFKRVLWELHKAMSVLLGSKVVSSRYHDAYDFCVKKFAASPAEATIMTRIPPDYANIQG